MGMTMNRARRLLLGMGLLGATGPLLAAPPRRLDRELAAIAADPACELASLSVLAIRAGQVSYSYQFGRRFIGHDGLPDKPVGPDTLFRIASISKMMTTLGLMRLLEDGKVSLDADVSGYLGFTLRNPHFPGQSITLRHLLTHTSSLRDDAGYSWGADVALKDVIDARMFAANAGPGAYFTYCNLGWGVIGTVMERVTGERFDRLMRRLLVEPLGLQAGYLPSELPPKALANLATLSLMFSRQWTYDGRNGNTSDGLFHCWGLGNEQFPDETGIRLVEGGGFPAVGHLGDAYGLMSVFAFDPKRRNGMIVLVGGTSTDPFAPANKGKYSSLARFQERILTALYRGAIMPINSA
jgi:CubicO group peptidase (beta-lactamase class C family)